MKYIQTLKEFDYREHYTTRGAAEIRIRGRDLEKSQISPILKILIKALTELN